MIPEIVAIGCAIATLRTDVAFEEEGWVEEVRIEASAREGCTVQLVLPWGVELDAWSGRVRPADGPAYRLDTARMRRARVDLDGTRVHEILVPELAEGDVLGLELRRVWTAPVDLVWTPGADRARFAELRVPRRVETLDARGVRADGRVLWTDRPDALTRVVLRHPWAPREAPGLPATAARGLDADAAVARAADLVVVPEAAFGRSPPVGDDAFALGVTDPRGFARTVVALAHGGPDRVRLGRWAPDGAEPGPGAPEAPVRFDADGPAILVPDGTPAPRTGAWHTADGPVAVADARRIDVPVRRHVRWPEDVAVDVHLAFEVEGPDPLRRFGRDDDLAFTARYRVSWDPLRAEPVFGHLVLPSGARGVEQPLEPDCGRLRATGDAVWFVGAPGRGSCTFTVVLPLDDAWGPLPPMPPHATVTAHAAWTQPSGAITHGRVVVEDGTWRLATLAGTPLLNDRTALERELDQRFRLAAMPEPGLSHRSRRGLDGWALAAQIRQLLAERALVLPLEARPDRPRGLVRARNGRVLTPGEAAMVGSLWLRQSRVRADWGLAAPRDAVRDGLAPVAHTAGVIRVEHEGRAAWIDVACEVCAPFEVRPSLVGADVLGPAPDRIEPFPLVDGLPRGIGLVDGLWSPTGPLPPYGIGITRLDRTGDEARLELHGAYALALRLALFEVPSERRAARLAELVGAGDVVPAFEGLAEAGAPVTLRAPVLAVPDLVREAAGLVEVRTPATGAPSVTCGTDATPWAYRREERDGVQVSLTLRRDVLDAEAEAALAACAAVPEAPPDEVEALDEAPLALPETAP